jgi:hypothetical protein
MQRWDMSSMQSLRAGGAAWMDPAKACERMMPPLKTNQ